MGEISGAIYKNMTASGVVKGATGRIYGVIVASHTTGTMKLWDNASAGSGTVIVNTYTYPTGSSVIMFPEPLNYVNGCYATLTNTQDVTFIIN